MLAPQAIHATIPQFGPAFRTLLQFCQQRFAPVLCAVLSELIQLCPCAGEGRCATFPALLAMARLAMPGQLHPPKQAGSWQTESKQPPHYSGITKTKQEAWLLAQIERCFPKATDFSFDGWPPRTTHQSQSTRARSSVSTLAPNFPHCLSTSLPSKEEINVLHNRAQKQCRKNYARVVIEDPSN